MNPDYCTFTEGDMDAIVDVCRTYDANVRARDLLAASGRCIALRHDIDNDMNEAAGMFEWEVAHGLVGTYYFQHDLPYFGSQEMFDLAHAIEAAGGEVGIHNNAIANRINTGTHEFEALRDAVALLRSDGLDVVGTSSHGDSLCHEFWFTNAECFFDVPPCYRFGEPYRTLATEPPVSIIPFPLASVGFRYQAEGIPGAVGCSDTGGVMPDVERIQADPRHGIILMHPQRWPI